MKKLFLVISIFILIFQVSAQVMWQFNKDTVVSWEYEWGDEFIRKETDTVQWTYSAYGGRSIYSNKEQQYYTHGKNHLLENGIYKILVKKEGIDARTIDGLKDNDSLMANGKLFSLNKVHFNYTSEKIESRQLFTGGVFEIRFKASKDRGVWPAFWLYGGNFNEEIDIFELKGEKKNKIHIDVHCNECDSFKTRFHKKRNWGGWLTLSEDLNEGFNVVSAEWDKNYIKFYLNGRSIGYAPVKFKMPKTLQVNVALPSNKGPFHPGPRPSVTRFEPFEVDYVRVWDRKISKKQNTVFARQMVRSSFSTGKEGRAKLKTKKSFLYGGKAIHVNEGPQISLFPDSKGNYLIFCIGLGKGEKFEVKLIDQQQREVYSKSSDVFQTELKFEGIPKGIYHLTIKCNGKEVSVPIELY